MNETDADVEPAEPKDEGESKPTSRQFHSKVDADKDDARFVCNICLDPVRDSVVTWLNIGHTTCPVCKAGVSKENVIPLYIRGSEEDPRLKTTDVPNRPNAHRPTPGPPMPNQGMPQNVFNQQFGGMSFSAGYGFFPSLFGLQFQTFAPPHAAAAARGNHQGDRALTPEEIQQNFVSRFLIMLGTFVILCLLLF